MLKQDSPPLIFSPLQVAYHFDVFKTTLAPTTTMRPVHNLLTLALATTALGSPIASGNTGEHSNLSIRDLLVSTYGPVETWDPILAIDVDPHGTYEGLPVNDSLIIGYEPPHKAYKAKRQVDGNFSFPEKRNPQESKCNGWTVDCRRDGSWVDQYQLYSAKDTFCLDAASRLWIEFDQDRQQKFLAYWQDKKLYQDRFGAWRNFNNHLGQTVTVIFYKQWNGAYSLPECQNQMEELVTRCRGDNPDSAGGCYAPWNGGYLTIDPSD